jgi:hypothetical protein
MNGQTVLFHAILGWSGGSHGASADEIESLIQTQLDRFESDEDVDIRPDVQIE